MNKDKLYMKIVSTYDAKKVFRVSMAASLLALYLIFLERDTQLASRRGLYLSFMAVIAAYQGRSVFDRSKLFNDAVKLKKDEVDENFKLLLDVGEAMLIEYIMVGFIAVSSIILIIRHLI